MKVRKIAKAKLFTYAQRQAFYTARWFSLRFSAWGSDVRRAARHLKVGTIIETCGLDVAEIVNVDWQDDSIKYKSLTRPDQGFGYCSIRNCGPLPLRPYAVERRLDLFNKYGKDGLSLRYYVEDCRMPIEEAKKQLDAFKAEWNAKE